MKKYEKLTLFIFILFLLTANNANGQSKNENYLSYIRFYQNLAVEHMNHYKIPASITLAQGLLESGAGTSYLAQNGNNHFGIKCSNWEGNRVYMDDDKKNECFRQYENAVESYEDHAKFLSERSNYSKLFLLETDDYKGWAKGLSECGYATDKSYATKLINLIELYELYQYDTKRFFPRNIYKTFGLIYVIATDNDSFYSIASDLNFKESDLLKYNEAPVDFKLRKGDIVYLQKKKKKADKPCYDHVVQPGESLYDISQKYGMQLSNLYKMNKKNKNEDFVLTAGTVLRLR